MRSVASYFAPAAYGICLGCGSVPPGAEGQSLAETFVVEVFGVTSVEEIASLGLEATRPGRLSTTAPWADLVGKRFEVDALRAGSVVSSVGLSPYLCAMAPSFRERLASGWRARELHQVFMSNTGRLEVDTDFEHPLHYECIWEPPDARGSFEGLTTFTSAPPDCADESRKNTNLLLEGTLSGSPVSLTPTYCLATLSNEGEGIFGLTLNVDHSGNAFTAVVNHCFKQGELVVGKPLELSIMSDDLSCSRPSAAGSIGAGGRRHLPALAGRWRIDSIENRRSGRTLGEVDVVFRRGADELRLTGVFDLPLVRVPSGSTTSK